MRLLELFSGTGSIGKVALQKGYDVVSVDIDPAAKATHTTDIMSFNYRQYPPYHFDVCWASPPCTEYSTIMNRRPRRLEEADNIVKHTLDIIQYFEPTYYFIENPRDGMLKSREFMTDIPYIDVSYCMYGYSYRKNTRIWTNIEATTPPMLCKGNCGKILNGKHIGLISKIQDLNQKHSIPPLLVEYLLGHCE